MIILLSGIVFSVSLCLLIRQLMIGEQRIVIAEMGMAEGPLNFTITESGKYTIWSKRKAKISVRTKGIDNHQYTLTDFHTQTEIPLIKLWDVEEDKEKRNKAPLFSGQWYQLYSFEVVPGRYQLRFEKHDHLDAPLSLFENLGFFNPFSVMDPDRFNVVVTYHVSTGSKLSQIVQIAFLITATAVSFILLYNNLLAK
jgi:hypothetical protein